MHECGSASGCDDRVAGAFVIRSILRTERNYESWNQVAEKSGRYVCCNIKSKKGDGAGCSGGRSMKKFSISSKIIEKSIF